ncbi:MAG: hypothetical protein HQL80_03525 [Magnetococcales bacterium]|nr:hypothetical protein [Magnetococcales bacterium]
MSNSPQTMHFECTRGDTKPFLLELSDPDGKSVDMTGQVLWFTVKAARSLPDSAAVIQKRLICSDDVNAVEGRVQLLLSSHDTDIAPGAYYYDFQSVAPSDPPLVTTLFAGRFIVKEDITRSVF